MLRRLVLVAGLVACASAPPDAEAPVVTAPAFTPASLAAAGWRVAEGQRGVFTLAWRPAGLESVPRNADCTLEVAVFQGGLPSSPRRVDARGWMPDHGHGLVQVPLTTRLDEGRYLVEGLRLHMRGRWQLIFDVEEGHTLDIVTFEVEL